MCLVPGRAGRLTKSTLQMASLSTLNISLEPELGYFEIWLLLDTRVSYSRALTSSVKGLKYSIFFQTRIQVPVVQLMTYIRRILIYLSIFYTLCWCTL